MAGGESEESGVVVVGEGGVGELKGEESESFFFQAENGIRDSPLSRGLGDVYTRQYLRCWYNWCKCCNVQFVSLGVSFCCLLLPFATLCCLLLSLLSLR